MTAVGAETLPQTTFGPEGIVEGLYTPTEEDYHFMGMAIEQARRALAAGDSPVGAVLVNPKTGYMLRSQTTEFRTNSLLRHAEINLLLIGAVQFGRDFSDCTMYSVVEPCAGCSYFIDKSQINRLVVSVMRADTDFFRDRPVNMREIIGKTPRGITVARGLRLAEVLPLFEDAHRRHWDNGKRDV